MPPASGTCVAQLPQPLVCGGDHRGHPFAGGIQRGAPRPRGLLGGQRLAESGRVLFAGAVAPARFPGVGEEHHRADHTVGQSLGVAVGVVGFRTRYPVGAGGVGDEGDGAVVAAKRRARQGKSAGGVAERFADRVAPGLGVTAVVDLVEDHQGVALLGAHPVQRRARRDLGVGDHHAVVLRRGRGAGVGEPRVQRQAVAPGGLRPLHLEMLGGHHHGDVIDDAMREQFGGDPQREGGLPGSRGGHGQEIARLTGQVLHQRAALPASQRAAAAGGVAVAGSRRRCWPAASTRPPG